MPMILKVTDYQDRGTSGVLPRSVFINTAYIEGAVREPRWDEAAGLHEVVAN